MYYYVARKMSQKMDKICLFFLDCFGGNGVPFSERKIWFVERAGPPLEVAREGRRKRVARFHKPLLVSVANQKERKKTL